MINAISTSGHITYGLVELICDKEAEINELSLNAVPGSTCYVIATGNKYIFSGGEREWKKMKNISGGSTSAEAQAQIEELQNELETKNEELNQAKQAETAAKADLTNANATIENLTAKVEKLSDVKVEDDTLVLPDELIDVVEG